MDKKKLTGIVMIFITFLFIGVDLQLSEIARYICIMAGQEFTFKWYWFLNPVSIVCIVGNLLIAAFFILGDIDEYKLLGGNKPIEKKAE